MTILWVSRSKPTNQLPPYRKKKPTGDLCAILFRWVSRSKPTSSKGLFGSANLGSVNDEKKNYEDGRSIEFSNWLICFWRTILFGNNSMKQNRFHLHCVMLGYSFIFQILHLHPIIFGCFSFFWFSICCSLFSDLDIWEDRYERGSLYCYFHRGMDGKCVGCVDKGDPYGFCFD